MLRRLNCIFQTHLGRDEKQIGPLAALIFVSRADSLVECSRPTPVTDPEATQLR